MNYETKPQRDGSILVTAEGQSPIRFATQEELDLWIEREGSPPTQGGTPAPAEGSVDENGSKYIGEVDERPKSPTENFKGKGDHDKNGKIGGAKKPDSPNPKAGVLNR